MIRDFVRNMGVLIGMVGLIGMVMVWIAMAMLWVTPEEMVDAGYEPFERSA
jgi:hypothetical protein